MLSISDLALCFAIILTESNCLHKLIMLASVFGILYAQTDIWIKKKFVFFYLILGHERWGHERSTAKDIYMM